MELKKMEMKMYLNNTFCRHLNENERNELLFEAAQQGNVKLLQFLIDAKTNINAINSNKCTALMYAVVFNQINSTSEVIRPVNNPHLRTTDNKLWGDLSGWVHYIKNTRIGLNVYKKEILERGQKLIQLIQKEYHLDNE